MPDLRCPKGHKITEEELRHLWAKFCQSKRVNFTGKSAGGRPPIVHNPTANPCKCVVCREERSKQNEKI